MNRNWTANFFRGLTLDVWKQAMTPEITIDEATFLANELRVREGGKLLDVPCGNGRLSFLLDEMGYCITGIDATEEFIAEAHATNKSRQTDITFVTGDMLELSAHDEFDGAFCMGNSFGFFDEADTVRFLKGIARSLKSGGRFVIDTLMVAESFLTTGGMREWQQIDEIYMLVENSYDCMQSIVKSTYTYVAPGKPVETHVAYYHIYTCGQIVKLFRQSDLTVTELYGSLDAEPYEIGAPRLLLVAEKQ